MNWQDILKIRQPSKTHKEMVRLRNKFDQQQSEKNKFDFSFKKTYTYDEFYNLVDVDIRRRLERLASHGRGLLSQEYRLMNMDKREKRQFMSGKNTPKPFTVEDVKDRIVINLVEGSFLSDPSATTEGGKLKIKLPYTKKDFSEETSNALDELYSQFGENVKQNKQKKWYQEFRRGYEASISYAPFTGKPINRPDFDSSEYTIDNYLDYMMGLLVSDGDMREPVRSGKNLEKKEVY